MPAIREAIIEYFEMLENQALESVFNDVVLEGGQDERFKPGDPRRCE